jgi:hypothetical protein
MRLAVDQTEEELRVSERRVCRVPVQSRSIQRLGEMQQFKFVFDDLLFGCHLTVSFPKKEDGYMMPQIIS